MSHVDQPNQQVDEWSLLIGAIQGVRQGANAKADDWTKLKSEVTNELYEKILESAAIINDQKKSDEAKEQEVGYKLNAIMRCQTLLSEANAVIKNARNDLANSDASIMAIETQIKKTKQETRNSKRKQNRRNCRESFR